MIRIIMERSEHVVELQLPTDYERVSLSLWRLGLKRDPGKYSLRDLNAVFRYDTPEEHQMIRLIDSGDTLMYVLRSIHEMIAPPYSIAQTLHHRIREGNYRTADEYYQDLENMAYDSKLCQTYFLFPISGQLTDKVGYIKQASQEMLVQYEKLIDEALRKVQFQTLYWESELFTDVEGAARKIMSAGWSIHKFDNRLYGQVLLNHTEPFTREEYLDVIDKIEMINSTEFALRMKQWSVMTDEGLLLVYLCSEDGEYVLCNSDIEDDDEDDEVFEFGDQRICPDCLERIQSCWPSARMLFLDTELENSND